MLDSLGYLVWLVYPLLLFALPDGTRVGPLAPETLIAGFYFVFLVPSIIVYSKPYTLIVALSSVPAWVWAYGLYSVALVGLKGSAMDTIRALSWIVVLFSCAVIFRDRAMRSRFWLLWVHIAGAAALLAVIKHGFAMPEEVHVLAWTHRTVLGYFLAAATLIGIVYALNAIGAARLYFAIVAGFCGFVMLLCLARGAWLVAIAGVVLIAVRRPRFLGIAATATASVVTVVIFAGPFFGAIAERAESIYNWEQRSSNVYRLNLYAATASGLPEIWVAGVPDLQFGDFLADHAIVRYRFFSDPHFATDSDAIHLLLLGGVPLLLLAALAARSVRARLLKAERGVDFPLDPVIALWALIIVQFFFDNLFSSALGWFYLGVLCSAGAIQPQRTTVGVLAR